MKRTLFAALLATLPAVAYAESKIEIHDPYARVSRPGAPTGAAFMVIHNHGTTADVLLSARSDVAAMVELHTHIETGDGIMQMTEIEGGIPLPADGEHIMARGGDHVMFMGLTEPLVQGQEITVTLVFEQAGEVEVVIPVDNERMDKHGGHGHGHGHGHSHSD
ncbi:MAG: copper chaperone PCu(A)C [Pseudomonadota bacterium]